MQGRPRNSDWGDFLLPEIIRAKSQRREERLEKVGEGMNAKFHRLRLVWVGVGGERMSASLEHLRDHFLSHVSQETHSS